VASEGSHYDLVVIGSGPAGYVGAIRAAQLGFNTACVEKYPSLGGTCLNVGCIPSKALLDSSEHFLHATTKLAKHGVNVTGVSLDLPRMMKRKEEVVSGLTKGIAGLLKKNKVTPLQGTARITKVTSDRKEIEVRGEKGTVAVTAERILIATGSKPSALATLPFDGKRVVSSTEALGLPAAPKHLVVVGAGFIGLEMGSVWARLGSRVTVVEFLDRIVPSMDREVASLLHKSLVKQGLEIRLSTRCLGAKAKGSGVEVETESEGKKSTLEADVVLVATGRRPYTEGLGLEELGIKKDKAGRIETDDHYRTSVPGIFAVGDVVKGPMLAHKAEDEAMAAVEIMAGHAGHVNYGTIPGVVYTWPELASVGETEEQLKERGAEFRKGTFPFLANGRAKAMEETEGMVKILADARTDRVLGVHIFGPRASDMIAEAVAVMEFGGSAEDIARTCHGHPTLSEVLREAALAVDRRQIHM